MATTDDRSLKGYDDKKEFTCVCCGKTVLLTKFASAKTAKCQECKASGANPDPNILSTIQAPGRSKSSSGTIQGDRKPSKCIKCGAPTMIGKFASHLNALCDECRGESSDGLPPNPNPRLDLSRINRSALPSLEDMMVIPTVIANKRLQHIDCPACGEPDMNVIKVMDASPTYGLVMSYQCKNPKCYLIATLSEQSRWQMKPAPESTVFNYRGEEIHQLIGALTDTRMKNSIEYLLKLCEDNGIAVDGAQVPETLRFVDRKKVVPIGFSQEATNDSTKVHDNANGGVSEQGGDTNQAGEYVPGTEPQLLQTS